MNYEKIMNQEFIKLTESIFSKTSFIGTPLKCKHLAYRDFEGLPTTTFSLMVGVPPRFYLTPLHVTMYKEWWLEEKQKSR